ncbi:hypothetical protein SCLCIDRAFT_1041854 [Scleroderma citrinum Foug A]|uniref:Uncharacterized protein n=1 Tax=Scleroderma citrinum Foug A TaxID=1036808 RepID=A0A0C3DS35_9AGAM|nr:hypothetical protein SCLCIDRAFT_1041854 [Scleroderma citrinum Foug A]
MLGTSDSESHFDNADSRSQLRPTLLQSIFQLQSLSKFGSFKGFQLGTSTWLRRLVSVTSMPHLAPPNQSIPPAPSPWCIPAVSVLSTNPFRSQGYQAIRTHSCASRATISAGPLWMSRARHCVQMESQKLRNTKT